MPFPDPGTYPISNKDVVSFTFDNPNYDVDRPVFIDPRDPSIYFSHRTSKELVLRLIAGLHAAGLQKGDTVCIHSFNSLVYPLLVLAIIGAGGVSVGTNPSYTKGELSNGVKTAEIKYVFAEPEILPNMSNALRENNIDIDSNLFVLDTQPDQKVPIGLKSWRTLLNHGTKDWIRFDDEHTSKDTVAQLYFTSGTTGLPKCAMTTHMNLVAEHTLCFDTNPRPYHISCVFSMPFFHVGILPLALVSALHQGRSAYIMRRFDLHAYLLYHAKYHITETHMVPPMVISIVTSGLADPSSPSYDPKYSLRSVRHGIVGAAPCSASMQSRFRALLSPTATFSQIWGMTETTCIVSLVPQSIAEACASGTLPTAWGSVGIPIPNTTMKLIDALGNDTTSSNRGELCVRGPTVVKGYFRNGPATNASWDSDGYFHTGDIVSLDPSTGLMFIVERLKELIKVRGFQVAPAELEGVLTEHPGIVDAGVIGVEDPNPIPNPNPNPNPNQSNSNSDSDSDSDSRSSDELPRAYIVIRPGWAVTEEDVHAHMKARLARYKQLTGGVVFVDEIPKLPSGKILKRVLRERDLKEVGRRRGRGRGKL